jgi:hypothetical protein
VSRFTELARFVEAIYERRFSSGLPAHDAAMHCYRVAHNDLPWKSLDGWVGKPGAER